MTRKTLKMTGSERIDILGMTEQLQPRSRMKARIHRDDGTQLEMS